MIDDLIEYEQCLEWDLDYCAFAGVTMKRDFGPWKKGETLNNLWLSFKFSKAEQYSDTGVVLRACRFQLTALEE